MIIFSWINAQKNILFELPNLKIILFGGRSDSCILGDKKLKMNHLGAYMLHGLSHLIAQRLQNVIIKQRGDADS